MDSKKFVKDLRHYIPLVSIVLVALVGFILFSYDRAFQTFLVIAVAAAYVAWGIVHHHIHKDLHLSVIIEYVVIATLGLVIVFSLLFRA
ncbi:MAG: hypothetical protein UT61_C0042G0006 [Candidatus Woesebacteria bacterium GW2011_GWA1_39_8]|jgi:hypothetical protein|uniref:Uncharacterized protein n=1 Tax=Candidatus Woesebacteria bacterium GW2011_GWA1_39_8 TaxID=1618552 RepID=A0A0G0PUJ7_9BACT|nr:MAG: hypothetical protein UT61_C0042G0006 [Candidatus Woesebacteria bacterium GW2011_GWA1_39_8]